MPVLILHGTEDAAVPYNGGPSTREIPGAGIWENSSVAQAVSFWAKHNQCPATPAETLDGSVLRRTYTPCAQGAEVTLYTIDGGLHAWPGGKKGRDQADDPSPVPDTTSVIWDFFARFPVR